MDTKVLSGMVFGREPEGAITKALYLVSLKRERYVLFEMILRGPRPALLLSEELL